MRRPGRRTAGAGTGAEAREGFEPVGAVLDQVLRSLRLETRFAAAEATDRWASAVEPAAPHGSSARGHASCVAAACR